MTREEFERLKAVPFFRGKIVTGSMDPVIKIGEEIVVDVGCRDFKRFDIIVFFQSDKLICHYLWRKNSIVKPVLYQTRALNGGYDLPVTEELCLGKVISHKLPLWRILKSLF